MTSDTPQSVFSPRARSSNRGFTLIELLVVIAIIMVLAGITFGISRGVQNAQARTRAKAELAVLSQGIEQFKLRYAIIRGTTQVGAIQIRCCCLH